MNANPLVSVLIPVYNVSEYVESALLSIINQTYRNLEILVIDDGSTDRTYDIIKDLSKRDDRIRLLKNNKNERIVATLNHGLKVARGEFIARMDGDDISAPKRIEAQLNFLHTNIDFDLVGLNVIMIDEHGREIHKERYPKDFKNIKESLKYVSPVPHFWLARKSLYENVGYYRIPGAEDFDFIYRAIDKGFKVSNLPDFLYYQRIRQGNTATDSGLFQKKSVEYVELLHDERVKSPIGVDNHSDLRLIEKLQTSPWERRSFKSSSKFHMQYLHLKSKRPVKALSMLLLACLMSPYYQLGAIIRRRAYKTIINSES